MAATDLIQESQALALVDAIATDINGLALGGSGVGWFDLSIFSRSNVAPNDGLLVYDVSDTTQSPDGTLKLLSLPGLAEVQRRLTTNYAIADTAAGFATDTYVVGSSIVLPEAPAVGSIYHALVKISKTAFGTAAPTFNLRIGTGVVGDTSRCTLSFTAGTAVADVALVELWFLFTGTLPTALVVNGEGNARNNLATTGFSGASKQATAAGGSFDASTTAGSTIGLSYNGGASAVHTIQFVHAEWKP